MGARPMVSESSDGWITMKFRLMVPSIIMLRTPTLFPELSRWLSSILLDASFGFTAPGSSKESFTEVSLTLSRFLLDPRFVALLLFSFLKENEKNLRSPVLEVGEADRVPLANVRANEEFRFLVFSLNLGVRGDFCGFLLGGVGLLMGRSLKLFTSSVDPEQESQENLALESEGDPASMKTTSLSSLSVIASGGAALEGRHLLHYCCQLPIGAAGPADDNRSVAILTDRR
ncbi:hypothetical protein E2C01_015204 [Portunus trituberculatus]|uniref:Uncharacterized protein n=1 Tax=Portunus trituberculatus TaxID=210409 RepID=A0A5B7DLY5_PORTR|nr:hypothetical protein [Portunus trituberculatus]